MGTWVAAVAEEEVDTAVVVAFGDEEVDGVLEVVVGIKKLQAFSFIKNLIRFFVCFTLLITFN